MSSFFATLGITTFFLILVQPFALLHFLPFRQFLPAQQQKLLWRGWWGLVLLEAAGFTLLQQQGIFEDSQTSYWVLRDCSWLPQVLLCLGFTSRFWIGQLYVFAFRILFSGILFTLSQGLSQEFFPLLATSQRAGQQTLLYGFLSLLAFPFLLRFFTQVFSHFSQAATRRYWRYITLIPVLLAVESLYVSLYDFVLPGVFDLLLPRFFLLVIAVLLLASIRTSQEEVYQGIQIFEKNHQLQQQFTSTENYIRLAQESRQRMEALYQEKRELLAYLLERVQQKDRDGVLHCIDKLGERFNTTKLPQYCQNPVINAALTVYFAKAREWGIPVTIAADLPPGLECSVDLSIVLSNLVENALLASQKQPREKRNITVLALHQAGVLNILVKNLFDAPMELDENGLPVTHVKGHGIGMKSLVRFQDKYGASILCQQKDGWFQTYLQVAAQTQTGGEDG